MVAVGSGCKPLPAIPSFMNGIIQINIIKIKGNIPRVFLEFSGQRTDKEG